MVKKSYVPSAFSGNSEKTVTVRGIKLSREEYEAFVNYLNAFKVQEYNKSDVEQFLETYSNDEVFKSIYKPKTEMAQPNKYIDQYDIDILERWLKLAKTEGTDKIKIVYGGKANIWTVTVIGGDF